MAKKEEAPAEEFMFTIPMRRDFVRSERVARSNRAVLTIENFVVKNLRSKSVKISPKLNEFIWKSGAKHPPGKVRVKVSIDDEGAANVRLPEEITLEEEKKKVLEEVKKEKEARKAEKKEEAKPETPAEEKPGDKTGEKTEKK